MHHAQWTWVHSAGLWFWAISATIAGNDMPQLSSDFIVEVDQGMSLDAVTASLDDTLASVGQGFNCGDIFVGAVIKDVPSMDSLASLPGVVNVWPVQTIDALNSASGFRHVAQERPPKNAVHQWTGVDKLHAAGIRGNGTTVAVIDTGIDYRHEALGGCFGPNCKVMGGYDLVGAKWTPGTERINPITPDDEPRDYEGHGTHVAGIIAGENEWFTGVAPDAKLLAYKVFPDVRSSTSEPILMQAFCDAYAAGADVITASINGAHGFADAPWALIASRIVKKGVFVAIAAGNQGSTGPFYSGKASNGLHVVSVAAVNATGDPTSQSHASPPQAADFTSWGPTNELLLKPDVAAPGEDIYSTLPNQDFGVFDGTSMAAPYIAGVAALYISQHGGRNLRGSNSAIDLAQRIITSGKNVQWDTGVTKFTVSAPVFQVGTGLVDAHKVLFDKTEVSFEAFSLQDTDLFKPDWKVRVTNHELHSVRYAFRHEALPGVEIYGGPSQIGRLSVLEPVNISAVVHLPPDAVLGPGEQKSFRIAFERPQGANEDRMPLYNGKIHIDGDNGEGASIPYGGAAYSTKKQFGTMFDKGPSIGWDNETVWSFSPRKIDIQHPDFAELMCTLNYPCTHFRWDIFERGWTEGEWKYPPRVGERRYVGSATNFRDAQTSYLFDPKLMDMNDTIPLPLTRLPRGLIRLWWFGKLSNGTQIAPGKYSMRIAALKPYGDPHVADHWDILHNPGGNNIEVVPMKSFR